MWLLFTLCSAFAQAVVIYIDEYLNISNAVTESSSAHKRIGGVLITSALVGFLGAFGVFLYLGDVTAPMYVVLLSLFSAIPLVAVYAAYFYLLLNNPSYVIAPLFQFSVIWVLLYELGQGAVISLAGLLGIALVVYGVYVLDVKSFRWKIPSRLLAYVVPASFLWALVVLLTQAASQAAPAQVVAFYQMLGTGLIGLILLLFVKQYRQGLIFRIKNQGKSFVTFSVLNELFWQVSLIFVVLAIAAAPLAAYFGAVVGVHNLIVLGLFLLFPLHERNKISLVQVLAIVMIVLGIFSIEFWRI
jgi:hypothetical protein